MLSARRVPPLRLGELTLAVAPPRLMRVADVALASRLTVASNAHTVVAPAAHASEASPVVVPAAAVAKVELLARVRVGVAVVVLPPEHRVVGVVELLRRSEGV